MIPSCHLYFDRRPERLKQWLKLMENAEVVLEEAVVVTVAVAEEAVEAEVAVVAEIRARRSGSL